MGLLRRKDRQKVRQRFEREALQHLDAVYRFALSMTRDEAEADDLVQETFYKAFVAFDSFQEGTNCRAWLFKIARNAYINRLRAASRQVRLEEAREVVLVSSLQSWSSRSYYRSPEANVSLAATRDKVMAALEMLPRDFRSVIVLADIEGLTYQEVAEVMGTPIGTVMSRLFRARRALRNLLLGQVEVGLENGNVVPFLRTSQAQVEGGDGADGSDGL